MKIVSAAEMRDIDRVTCSKYKVPSLTLMENAGSAVAEYILQHYPHCNSVGVICGKGNNGGDGFVAARRLHETGKSVRVLLLAASKDLSGDAAKMLKRLPVKPLEVRTRAELKKLATQVYAADVLVDALLGTGFRPPLSELYAEAIALFWKQPVPIVSVDIPSGLEADATEDHSHSAPHVPASATVTFTAAKPTLVLRADPNASPEERSVARVLAAFQAALPAEARDILALATAFRQPPTEARLLEYLASFPLRAVLHATWKRSYARFHKREPGWLPGQLQQLVDLRLLERVGGDGQRVIDAHPLVRRAFEQYLGQAV